MGPTIQTVLDEQVIPIMKESKQGGGDRRHSARCNKSVLRTFNRGKLLVERPSVRRVVQANIFNIMIAGFATGLEHGRLEYRHTNSPQDSRFRLARMDKFSLDFLEFLFLQDNNQILSKDHLSIAKYLVPVFTVQLYMTQEHR